MDLFTYLAANGHLGCFTSLILSNEAVMSFHVQVFMDTYFCFSWAKYLGLEELDHLVAIYLTF